MGFGGSAGEIGNADMSHGHGWSLWWEEECLVDDWYRYRRKRVEVRAAVATMAIVTTAGPTTLTRRQATNHETTRVSAWTMSRPSSWLPLASRQLALRAM